MYLKRFLLSLFIFTGSIFSISKPLATDMLTPSHLKKSESSSLYLEKAPPSSFWRGVSVGIYANYIDNNIGKYFPNSNRLVNSAETVKGKKLLLNNNVLNLTLGYSFLIKDRLILGVDTALLSKLPVTESTRGSAALIVKYLGASYLTSELKVRAGIPAGRFLPYIYAGVNINARNKTIEKQLAGWKKLGIDAARVIELLEFMEGKQITGADQDALREIVHKTNFTPYNLVVGAGLDFAITHQMFLRLDYQLSTNNKFSDLNSMVRYLKDNGTKGVTDKAVAGNNLNHSLRFGFSFRF